MKYLVIIAVAGLILLIIFWVIELFASINRAALRGRVDTVLDSNRIDQMMQELNLVDDDQFTREEIWQRMRWIWHEIRVFALVSNRFIGHLLLFQCSLIYCLVWAKTLIRPSGRDLRILLGAELFVLCQVKRDR